MNRSAVVSPQRKEFAQAFYAAAEAALARRPGIDAFVSLAGLKLRLRFAAAELSDAMLPAFEHVRSLSSNDALDVIVWDSFASGVPLPAEAGRPAEHSATGLGQLQHERPILSLFDQTEGSLSMLNFETQKAVYWLPNAARTSERDRAAPLQTILNWWLPVHDRTIVHAAAVGTEAGSVLLLGKSGAGKSTLALACVQAGLHYLGDDLCAISETDPPIAQSLYCSAKLRPDNLSRFPDFASLITNSGRLDSEKAIGYIRQASVRASSPVRHLVVLGQKGCREPAVVRISGATAFRAFAPSTFHNFPGHGKDELAGLAALVARVPCYQMDLAMDFEANAEALRELLASTPSRG